MLQEELGKGIKVIGEQYFDTKQDIATINQKLEKLDKIAEDVAVIKISFQRKANQDKVDELERRVEKLEARAL